MLRLKNNIYCTHELSSERNVYSTLNAPFPLPSCIPLLTLNPTVINILRFGDFLAFLCKLSSISVLQNNIFSPTGLYIHVCAL